MNRFITLLLGLYCLVSPLFGIEVKLSSQTLGLGDVLRIDVFNNAPLSQSKILLAGKPFDLFLFEKKGKTHHYRTYAAIDRHKNPGQYLLRVDLQGQGLDSFYEHYKIRLNYKKERPKGKVALSKSGQKAASNRNAYKEEGWLLSKAFKNKRKDFDITGPLVVPAKGRYTSGFAKIRSYSNGKESSHAGLDIGNKKGTAIVAPEAGVVTLSKTVTVHGNLVVIDHGFGIQSVFAHMDSRSVKEGDTVMRGQRIGTMGDTGVASGVHLHWGISVQNVRVDPVRWLSKKSQFL